MNVRPARREDAAAIARIWNAAIRESAMTFTTEEKSEGLLSEQIVARGRAFQVAEADGQVIGFATYFQFRGGPGYRHTMEHSVFLDPAAKGRGAGRALMVALLDAAQDAGVHSVFAGVSSENPDAVRFHEKLGFQQVATLKEVGHKFGRWMDLVLLQKIL